MMQPESRSNFSVTAKSWPGHLRVLTTDPCIGALWLSYETFKLKNMDDKF